MDEKVAGIFKPVAKCTNVKPKQMWITFATQVRSVLKTIKYSGIKKKKKKKWFEKRRAQEIWISL